MVDQSPEMYVEENALVAEFPPDMRMDETAFAEVNEEFQRLATQDSVDTHITVLEMDDPMGSGVFEKAKEAAHAGKQHGITTWIAVSDDIKSLAVSGRVGDIPGVEAQAASDFDEAMELARQ